MVKIKFCGLKRNSDIEAVNLLKPDFIGFVFAPQSKRFINFNQARCLKQSLNKEILTVGVFVDEPISNICKLLEEKIIDIAQLHGKEDNNYIKDLKKLSNKTIIKAFKIKKQKDILEAQNSEADYILLDSGSGSGEIFNWDLIKNVKRPYFLAGGLNINNLNEALKLKPFALDVSSGIETEGFKDKEKMKTFMEIIKKGEFYAIHPNSN